MARTAHDDPRILIVADGDQAGEAILSRLSRLGFGDLALAATREKALELAIGRAPNLALVGIEAPDEPFGLEMASLLGDCCGLPVVFLADRVDRDRLRRVGQTGIRGCIPASGGNEVLLAGLDMALRHDGSGPSDEQTLRHSLDHMRRTLEQTVNALAVTSEKRDPFTAGHQQRVSQLAEAIAVELGLPEISRDGVRMAGLVHDIGKIHVPSEILAKTEALSALELRIVQGHSQVGYEILKDIPFPWPVARMVLEHHERLDGSGYPSGLRGTACLPESRILAVADVVEAMTAHRPYRAAYSLEQALEELTSGRGERYDPDVVDGCLLVCRKGNCM